MSPALPLYGLRPDTMDFARSCIIAHARYIAVRDFECQVQALTDTLTTALEQFFTHLACASGACPPDPNPPYVTINPATDGRHYNVVVMACQAQAEEYTVKRMSHQMVHKHAVQLAHLWAAAGGWDIR